MEHARSHDNRRMLSLDLPHGSKHLHVADFGGATSGPTFVLVHGLGGSHANYVSLAPRLALHGRVLAVDLPGFGLSPPEGPATVRAHVDALAAVLRALERGAIDHARAPVVLVGNSMGGAVAIALAARQPEAVRSLVLVCPALPVTDPRSLDRRFALLLGTGLLPGYDWFLRARLGSLGPETMVRQMLALTCVAPARVEPQAVEAMNEVARRRMRFPWMGSAFSQSARSIVATLLARRTFRDQMRAVQAPTLLVHGARDGLVPVAAAHAAREACPAWAFEVYDDVGHVPQLEAPDLLTASIVRFLAR